MKSLIFILSIILFAQLSFISLSRLRTRAKDECAQYDEECITTELYDIHGNCCNGECQNGICSKRNDCTTSGGTCFPGSGSKACCSGCSSIDWKCI